MKKQDECLQKVDRELWFEKEKVRGAHEKIKLQVDLKSYFTVQQFLSYNLSTLRNPVWRDIQVK